jgi:hypothetical protein
MHVRKELIKITKIQMFKLKTILRDSAQTNLTTAPILQKCIAVKVLNSIQNPCRSNAAHHAMVVVAVIHNQPPRAPVKMNTLTV